MLAFDLENPNWTTCRGNLGLIRKSRTPTQRAEEIQKKNQNNK